MASTAKYKRGGGESCAVVGCSNNRKKLYEWKVAVCIEHGIPHVDCPCRTPYSLHVIPKDERKGQWTAALHRKSLPQTALVCSEHFVDGRPTEENNVPSLKLGYDAETKKGRRILKRKFTPNNNSAMRCNENTEHSTSDEDEIYTSASPADHRNDKGVQTCNVSTSNKECSTSSVSTQWYDTSIQDHTYTCQHTGNSVATQTPISVLLSKGVNCTTVQSTMSSDKLTSDSESLLYTGLTLEVFFKIVAVVHVLVTPFKFTMPTADQLLLFFMRLRLNLLFADLGHRFGVSESQASKIFNCWLPFLSSKLKDLIIWLPRETIRATMPSAFKERYPKTTVIIDCAETYMQRPKNLKTRGETFSHYKYHNTIKYLVGISPHGQIMFISKGFGGRASDKFIVEKSGFLQYLLPGDEVMADRGFTITDLLFPLKVKLNMPAFTKCKPQLSEAEVTETRRIAHVRIHIERAIRRLKVFKILSGVVPVTSVKKLDDILTVCSALVNLRPDLIKDANDLTEESLSDD